MKVSIVSALLLASAELAQAGELNLVKRDNPAVVMMPIQKRTIPAGTPTRRLRKRANTVNVALTAIESTAYYAQMSFGTPGQTVTLDIDTGSSDTWVLSSTAPICKNNGCSANGVYTASKSSTYNFVNSQLSLAYGDGTTATGNYVTDNVTISGANLSQFQFGVVNSYNSQVGDSATLSGLIGLGYEGLEAAQTEYVNLPVALANAGIINTPAYSLYLDDIRANKGQLLFGGVNRARYTGTLATLPLLVREGDSAPYEFFVEMTGLSISNSGTNVLSSTPQAVLLDSGSEYITIGQDIIEGILTAFNGSYDLTSQSLVLPCSLQSSSATVNFIFGAQTIAVPIGGLLAGPDTNTNGKPLVDANNKPLCLLGMSPASSGDPLILGDTFLRNAYVVYDLNNYQVAMANTKFNVTTDDIVEITGTNGQSNDVIPGATSLAQPTRTTLSQNSATGRGPIGGGQTQSSVGGVPQITGHVSTQKSDTDRVQNNGLFGLVAAAFGALALL